MQIRALLFKFMVERLPIVFSVYRRLQNWLWFFRKPKQTPYGFLFSGRPDMETGQFELAEVEEVSSLLESVSEVVNIGANFGYYSCLARARGKHVIAVEPLALNFRILLQNFLVNGWEDVEAYPVGISDKPGIAKLFGWSTQASLLRGWSSDKSGRYTLIPVTTLDLLLGDRLHGKKTLFIVDIEGAEYRLLLGASKQLSMQPRPIWFIEVCVSKFQPQGVPINPYLLQTFDLFFDHGYTCHMLAQKRVPISRAQVVEWSQSKNLPEFYNFIFE